MNEIELIQAVQEWAKSKGIYEKSTALAQLNGARGEIGELREAIIKDNIEEAKLELGDVMVFFINYLTMEFKGGYSIHGSLFGGYDDKEDRFEYIIAWLYDDIDGGIPVEMRSNLATMASYLGSTPFECLKLAYNKISKRKTKMINGKAVKEEDLKPQYHPYHPATPVLIEGLKALGTPEARAILREWDYTREKIDKAYREKNSV